MRCPADGRAMTETEKGIWHCPECGGTFAAATAPTICGQCRHVMEKVEQKGLVYMRCINGHELWTYEGEEDEADERTPLERITSRDIMAVLAEDRQRGIRKGSGGRKGRNTKKKGGGVYRAPWDYQ